MFLSKNFVRTRKASKIKPFENSLSSSYKALRFLYGANSWWVTAWDMQGLINLHACSYVMKGRCSSEHKNWLYLGVRTCELFLCLQLLLGLGSSLLCRLLCFLCFTSLVSVTGSYTEVNPKNSSTSGLWSATREIKYTRLTCYLT